MKYTVYKKWASSLLPATILVNLAGLFVIIVAALDQQVEASFVLIYISVALIVFNGFLFDIYRAAASSVIFEKDLIRCSFLNITRRLIPYNEVRDYGIYWEKGVKYIFISKVPLSEFEKERKASELYKRTKNVIIVQYHEEIMDFLRDYVVLERKN